MKQVHHKIHADNRYLQALIAAVGSAFCIAILSGIDQVTQTNYLLVAPFGATMVLVFGLHQSPLAQPSNIIFGHLVTAAVGLAFINYLPVNPYTLGGSVGIGIFLMIALKVTHPPAGGNPLLIMLTGHTDWMFLLTPILTGTTVIVVVAFLYHLLIARNEYPFVIRD